MTTEAPGQSELIRLVERDSDQTSEFIRSTIGTTSITRGWAVTAWLAVLGVGIQQKSWPLAALASVAILPFALLDAYFSWLYSQALKHARELERLSAAYYRTIELGDDDPELKVDFEAELGGHKFGLYSHFRRFALRELLVARPVIVFRYFYPGLIFIAAVTALIIGLSTAL